MANQTTPIPHADLGRGIDQFTPENRLPDGFWQDILNGVPKKSGSLTKRRGYQRFAGYIPMRVATVQHTGTSIDFTLDDSFDLTDLRTTPILVYGRLSASQSGDFSTSAVAKYYTSFSISSGKIRVTDSGATNTNYTDSEPQLVIYGLDWSSDIAATDAGSKWGWVTHLDTYRSQTAAYPVAGLGGNFFAARDFVDLPNMGLSTLYPSIRGTKTAGSTVVGPAFWSTSDSPTRSRGYVKGSDVTGNYARVTAVAWNSSTEYVDVTLSISGMSVSGTPIEADKDWLTLADVPSEMEGTWLIRSVTQGAGGYTLAVEIPAIVNARFDDSGLRGRAAVLTDKIPLTATAQFVEGDVVASTGMPAASTELEVVTVSGSDVYVDGFATQHTLGAGEVVYGTRTSQVLVTRNSSGTASTGQLVRGDVLQVAGYTRRPRVVNLNLSSNRGVDISCDGSTATVDITSGDTTSNLAVGDWILLRSAGVYTGAQRVTAISNSTSLEFDSTETDSVTGATLVGGTIGLDEALEVSDDSANSTSLKPHARWIPCEWPTPVSSYVTQTRTQHFDLETYDEQNFIRSTMMADNMYFTDGEHDVMKWDGTNLTRAGLPHWQLGLFIGLDADTGGKIVRPYDYGVAWNARSGNKFTVTTSGEEKQFTSGDGVYARTNTTTIRRQFMTVQDTETAGVVRVSTDPGGAVASGTLEKTFAAKYYLRLNMIDANNNVIASAQVNHEDLNILFNKNASVQLKFMRPPILDGIDHQRIEAQVYRTKLGGSPPYFLLATLPVSYTARGQGYIFFKDTLSDIMLTDLDPVASALVGDELGTAWDCPPRAKYISSASSRLLLGNIKGRPELDITIRKANGNTAIIPSQASGTTFTFRRDSSGSGTLTDMVDTAVYEYVATSYEMGMDLSEPLVDSTNTSFSIDTSASGAGTFTAGDWVYLFADGPSWHSNKSHFFAGWYQVASVSAGTSGSGYKITINAPGPRPSQTLAAAGIDTGTDVITLNGHGFVDGDPIIITGGSGHTGFSGGTVYFVGSATTNTFKLHTTYDNAIAASSAVNIAGTPAGTYYVRYGQNAVMNLVVATNKKNIPVYLRGLSSTSNDRLDGGWNNWTSPLDRQQDDWTLALATRLAAAINASMVMADTSVSGQSSFKPWMVAAAGNDYAPGQIVVTQPQAVSTTMAVLTPNTSNYSVFVNNLARAAATAVTARTRTFPSRICRSYPNYPEIFDNPFAFSDSDSDSAIDVNPADGQEITGMIPMFGDSAFGSAQKEGLLLVFKEYSVYLVDVEGKRVQKLETNGQGCTYPRSVAPTKHGILFANDSGLWKINRQLECVYVGQVVDRLWARISHDDVDADLPCATHSYRDNQYLLSVPVAASTENDEVYVYDHTRESGDEQGAWTRFDNFPATWWTNHGPDSLFGSTGGLVYSRRRAGDDSDYRDDADAITLQATYKAMNFGTAALRKCVEAVVATFRVASSMAGTTLRAATQVVASFADLDDFTFEALDAADLTALEAEDGLGDVDWGVTREVTFSLPERKVTKLQIQIENSAADEPVELTQLDFLVAPLDGRGTEEAAETADA
jgi:hypothetical protein